MFFFKLKLHLVIAISKMKMEEECREYRDWQKQNKIKAQTKKQTKQSRLFSKINKQQSTEPFLSIMKFFIHSLSAFIQQIFIDMARNRTIVLSLTEFTFY